MYIYSGRGREYLDWNFTTNGQNSNNLSSGQMLQPLVILYLHINAPSWGGGQRKTLVAVNVGMPERT
jgi:hypothetical protein